MTAWKSTAPPNEVWVEVKLDGEIKLVKAMWGRDGMLPHWEDSAGAVYGAGAFRWWREIEEEPDDG